MNRNPTTRILVIVIVAIVAVANITQISFAQENSEFPPPADDAQAAEVRDREWYMENWQLTDEDWEEWAKDLVESQSLNEPIDEQNGPLSRAPMAVPQLNLAVGQTAIQSSTWDESTNRSLIGSAGRAVDGNLNDEYKTGLSVSNQQI